MHKTNLIRTYLAPLYNENIENVLRNNKIS